MASPTDIIDREAEWKTLERCWERDRPELVFVLGRRRVGKSHLLTRFARSVGGIYYQATRQSETEQRAALARVIGAHFGEAAVTAGATFPTWEALFDYLTSQMEDGEPLLLILDEFPYLTDSSGSLTSVIQRFWDHPWQDSRIRLVLCGSYITSMLQLEATDQPLHGRRTTKLHVRPFSYPHTVEFVPGWTARDRLLLYGIVGNLPGHLALVDDSVSLGANVAELMLDPAGRLVDESQHMLDAFTPHADVRYSLLEAIASGDRTWSRITSRVGKSGGSVSRPLEWLEEMEIIERVVPVTVKNPARSRRVIYRIRDPYVSFWHTVVAPLHRTGTIGLADPDAIWRDMVEPRLDDYMGGAFEQICREWVASAQKPLRPVRLGSWWDAKSNHEVDLVALSSDDELFVAECKWGAVTGAHLEKLRERSDLVARELTRASNIRLGLFTGRGEADETVTEAANRGDVELFGPDDLV